MRFPDPPNILDAEAAEELLAFFDKFPILRIAGFSLWTFDEMTPEAAKVIANSGMDILFLDSVKFVSPEVVRILAESPVNFLSLGGLEEISPEVATILSGFRGSFLKLDGLTDISPEVAAICTRFPKLLSLGGIKTLSIGAAKALAQHRGELMLDGILYLPEDVAEAISRHQGTLLSFESLRFLSDGAAKALAGYRGKVEMPVVEMEVKAAYPNISCPSSDGPGREEHQQRESERWRQLRRGRMGTRRRRTPMTGFVSCQPQTTAGRFFLFHR